MLILFCFQCAFSVSCLARPLVPKSSSFPPLSFVRSHPPPACLRPDRRRRSPSTCPPPFFSPSQSQHFPRWLVVSRQQFAPIEEEEEEEQQRCDLSSSIAPRGPQLISGDQQLIGEDHRLAGDDLCWPPGAGGNFCRFLSSVAVVALRWWRKVWQMAAVAIFFV